ncbi:F-box Kelch-repeat protein [Musa troglodytarum]|uniref:F-box Kelch-repeat protein n=1 Tax=Musa troglodytarum TaxID=320322 RepID=A0A9E7EA76_9LILI|nr:F-box Kelch-repeat protein [Musa troglodytarum]
MDVLGDIVSRLSHRDYVRCTAVCRSWRPVPPPPRPGARSMRLFVLPGNGECSVIDPSRNAVIHVDFPELAGVEVLSSKAGWLLLRGTDLSFFFFRPSTRTCVDLPQTNRFLYPQNYTAAFSAAPTSPDCVAVILNCLAGRTEVWTWRPGDDRWTVRIFAETFVFTGVYKLFACGHLFYCQGYDLRLCVFDAREGTWGVAEVIRDFTYIDCETYLTEFEGELHVVFFGGCCTRVCVHRVDSSLTLKEEVRSLEDRTVYVGRWTADMVRSTEGRVMNKVYFPITLTRSDKYLHHFSMKTEKYYPNLPLNMRKKLHTIWRDGIEQRVWIEADKSMLGLEESMSSSRQ